MTLPTAVPAVYICNPVGCFSFMFRLVIQYSFKLSVQFYLPNLVPGLLVAVDNHCWVILNVVVVELSSFSVLITERFFMPYQKAFQFWLQTKTKHQCNPSSSYRLETIIRALETILQSCFKQILWVSSCYICITRQQPQSCLSSTVVLPR